MLGKVMSVFNCDSEELFGEVEKTKSLYIAKPLIKFRQLRSIDCLNDGRKGSILLKCTILGFIPFGKQWIVISIDNNTVGMRDNGYSK